MSRRGVAPSDERLRRLLAVLPWLMARGRASVAETAARFDIPEQRLVRDLELAAMCGLPPYVDELIDLYIDDGVIHVGVERIFTKPMRLTTAEGFALLAAGRALLEVPGLEDADALARVLAKVEASLGAPIPEVDLGSPEFLGALRDAVDAHETVEITYWSAWRDATSVREVEPWAVFSVSGRWYLAGRCLTTDAERHFRVDRIEALRLTGEHFAPVEYRPDLHDPLAGGAGARTVTLRLPAAARWVVETYPVDEVEERPDGTMRVVLPVLSRSWLEILLLRIGPAAVVESPGDLAGVGREAAARLAARYEGSSAPP